MTGWEIMDNNNGPKEDKLPVTKFKNGTTKIRCLDPAPAYAHWNHWIPTAQSGVACLGAECPICAVNNADKANKKTPKYGNTKRFAMRIWNYETGQFEVLIQGRNFFENLKAFSMDKDFGDIRGYDVKVIRTGEDQDTKYSMIPGAKKAIEEVEDIPKEIPVVDWDERFKPLKRETVVMLMEGKTWDEIRELTAVENGTADSAEPPWANQ